MTSVAVMVLIETDDPVLIRHDIRTVAKAAAVRAAIIRELPKLTRVIMVTEEETARLMCHAHDVAARAAGIEPGRPPRRYVPPTRE